MDETGHDTSEPVVRPVFTGHARKVVCGEVSGADCRVIMESDAPHCGNEEHQRLLGVEACRGVPAAIAGPRIRRPSLVVDEEYELVLDPADIDAVWVAMSVQRDFTAFHGGTPEEAIESIRLVVARARELGRSRTSVNGLHHLEWRGFHVVLTPDRAVVVRYTTQHFERTPRQVADGVKSRFKGRTRGSKVVSRDRKIPDGFAIGDVIEGSVSSTVTFGVFVDLGGCDGLLHVSRLAPEMQLPREYFRPGDQLRVTIIAIDRDNCRVQLDLG